MTLIWVVLAYEHAACSTCLLMCFQCIFGEKMLISKAEHNLTIILLTLFIQLFRHNQITGTLLSFYGRWGGIKHEMTQGTSLFWFVRLWLKLSEVFFSVAVPTLIFNWDFPLPHQTIDIITLWEIMQNWRVLQLNRCNVLFRHFCCAENWSLSAANQNLHIMLRTERDDRILCFSFCR